MISTENIVTYLGATAIIYCLIKAFGEDIMDNTKTAILVVSIMAIIIFIANRKSNGNREHYRVVNPPLVDGLFESNNSTGVFKPTNSIAGVDNYSPEDPEYMFQEPEPLQKLPPPGTVPKVFDYGTKDQDLIDFMNIAGVDKKAYEDMLQRERIAKQDIRKRFKDEMVYTSSNPFNTVPLGRELNSYTYLPEFAWFRGYEQPPVCASSGTTCPVCPMSTMGTSELMHFDSVNNVRERPPQSINLKYTKDILNGGR